MNQRAEQLASKFDELNNEVIQAVENCSDEQWRAICQEEGWPVAVTAHHIASGLTPISGLIRAMAAGVQFPPLTLEQIDQSNAKHAQDFANCSKEETVEILRRDGAAITSAVRSLSDEELDKSAVLLAGEQPTTTEQAIHNVLIASSEGHLASIRASI